MNIKFIVLRITIYIHHNIIHILIFAHQSDNIVTYYHGYGSFEQKLNKQPKNKLTWDFNE